MRKIIEFLFVVAMQAVLLGSFISILSIWMREDRFDHAVRIGWPLVFFSAFDVGNPTLNHGGNPPNLIVDYLVAFVLSVPLVWIFRLLLERRR